MPATATISLQHKAHLYREEQISNAKKAEAYQSTQRKKVAAEKRAADAALEADPFLRG